MTNTTETTETPSTNTILMQPVNKTPSHNMQKPKIRSANIAWAQVQSPNTVSVFTGESSLKAKENLVKAVANFCRTLQKKLKSGVNYPSASAESQTRLTLNVQYTVYWTADNQLSIEVDIDRTKPNNFIRVVPASRIFQPDVAKKARHQYLADLSKNSSHSFRLSKDNATISIYREARSGEINTALLSFCQALANMANSYINVVSP